MNLKKRVKIYRIHSGTIKLLDGCFPNRKKQLYSY